MLLLHYTGMATGAAALARLCDPEAEVSAHYLVWEDGVIDQLVPEAARAWHAGRASWCGETDINSVSIGIEIVNAGHDGGCPAYPKLQIDAVIALCRDIVERHAIASSRVLAHSDVAPWRKQDPGEAFPWGQLAANGIGVWPQAPAGSAETAPLDPERMCQALAAIGYAGCEGDNAEGGPDSAVVSAFQRHWRPSHVDGQIDGETAARIAAVELAMATQVPRSAYDLD